MLASFSCITPCFFSSSSGAHRDLHSFPTRRSSDLDVRKLDGRAVTVGDDHGGVVGGRAQLIVGVDGVGAARAVEAALRDRKSTRLNSSHRCISYAVFCLKKKNNKTKRNIHKERRYH